MAINIPSKFGSGLPPEQPRKGIDFGELTRKTRFEREHIQPYLTNHQLVLYHHRCDLFVGNYYHGKNHFLNVDFTSNESEEYPPNRNIEYDEVGNILAHI
ncbi:hypothetical protein [Nodularia spumigena]|uniref:Uncharacterized protein n=1 Tax=Nodularia spumigena UHCC 0060 TaxID=3110300 RepID=A0ABU5UVF6_NODSP|nr:hypothetical protein [Nodularia spumigena]MEA5526940.1 hypothetical protein [Nodularia spumigena UHCC 0143]MEA5609828.1 hypothetical protein [Nodularia spumigena UHCC 0060]MEA5615588.1 hypothetical protein [Nodularia spumigena UHCC 0040]